MLSPEEFLEEIDLKYSNCKKRKISRLSDEWDKWSREFNLRLRNVIQDNNNPVAYKYVFIYWANRSQLLEIFYKKLRIVKGKKIKALANEGANIKKAIMNKTDPFGLKDKTFLGLAVEYLLGEGRGVIK